jgi:hypothetical protein
MLIAHLASMLAAATACGALVWQSRRVRTLRVALAYSGDAAFRAVYGLQHEIEDLAEHSATVIERRNGMGEASWRLRELGKLIAFSDPDAVGRGRLAPFAMHREHFERALENLSGCRTGPGYELIQDSVRTRSLESAMCAIATIATTH